MCIGTWKLEPYEYMSSWLTHFFFLLLMRVNGIVPGEGMEVEEGKGVTGSKIATHKTIGKGKSLSFG